MHIAIMGSAFDPLTEAHLAIAETVLNPTWGGKGPHGPLGALWLVPCPPRYDKTPKAPAHRRFHWAQLGAKELNRRLFSAKGGPSQEVVVASDVELRLSTQIQTDAPEYVGYRGTLFLLRALKQQNPQHQFSLIIGEDSLHAVEVWKDPATQALTGAHLLQEFPLYVVPRPGNHAVALQERLFRLSQWEPQMRVVVLPPLAGPLGTVSSTGLRTQMARGVWDGALPQVIGEDVKAQGNPYLATQHP